MKLLIYIQIIIAFVLRKIGRQKDKVICPFINFSKGYQRIVRNKGNPIAYTVWYCMEKNANPNTNGNTKYAMKVLWDVFLPFIIVIGQNPSISKKFKIDPTNENLVKSLKAMGYGGYIMLNTFPIICSKDAYPPKKNGKNIRIARKVILANHNMDVLLACSFSNPISSPFYDQIISKNMSKMKVCYYAGNVISHFSQMVFNRNHYTNHSFLSLKTITTWSVVRYSDGISLELSFR